MRSERLICTVTNDLNQDQRMFRICFSLQKMGFDVTLVGRLKKSSLPLPETTFQTKRLRCFFQRGFGFYAEYNIRLFLYLLTQRFSVLYAVDLDTIAPVGLVAALKNQSFIFDAHEHFTETPELLNKKRTRNLWSNIAHFWVSKAAVCITVNESLANLFTTLYNNKFIYLYNVPLLDLSKCAVIPAGGTKRILYQGVLNHGRGLESLITAMEHLPECELYIVGEGDLSVVLRDMVAKSPASDRIIFTGWKHGESLKQMTRNAWLGVNFLEGNSLSYYYSLANKFFDYIYAELPAVHMNFPEYAHIISTYPIALTIDEISSQKIVNTIRQIIDHPEKYEDMKRACSIAKKEFFWEKEEKKLIEVCSSFLKKSDNN
ncbi:MAG: glycosyltransferase [Saprospiraceae bacterium]|nr:glycosyltransferase [Saprospiraceae bacterium]